MCQIKTDPHWWILDPPIKPKSKGKCKKCGAVKWFPNQLPGMTFKTFHVELRDPKRITEMLLKW